MSHVRTQIRKAVAQALTDANVAGGRVHSTRVYPEQTMPAVNVWTQGEEVIDDRGIFGSASIEFRSLLLVVEARERAAQSQFPDDKLDNLCEAIEPVMGTDPTWGGLALTTEYSQTEIVFDAETEQPQGIARLTWRIEYRVSVLNPSNPLA